MSGKKPKKGRKRKPTKSKRLEAAELDQTMIGSKKPKGARKLVAPEVQIRKRLTRHGVSNWSHRRIKDLLKVNSLTESQAVDLILMREQGDKLLERLEAEVSMDGLEVNLRKSMVGYVFEQNGEAFAVLTPTRATVKRRPSNTKSKIVSGRFVESGGYWSSFNQSVKEWVDPDASPASAKAPREKSLKPVRPIERKEASTHFEVVTDTSILEEHGTLGLARKSSDRIKQQRQLALPHTAVLKSDDVTLTLDPVVAEGRAPRVPFRFQTREHDVRGEIYLKSPEDPLAIGVRPGSTAKLGVVWARVLEGYADLTCPIATARPEDVEPTHPGGSKRQELREGQDPKRKVQTNKKVTTNRYFDAHNVSPATSTVGALSSFVMGHKRLLGSTKEPTPEARKRAEDLGIALGPNETWVRPHLRGSSPDLELVFIWKSSAPVV